MTAAGHPPGWQPSPSRYNMPSYRAAVALGICFAAAMASLEAQSIRDRIRLSPEKRNPITEEQANELTLTLNEAAIRPIQVWVRTAGKIDSAGRTITAPLSSTDGALIEVGQRVRAFPPESRSSMFQARISHVALGDAGATVTATLSGPAHAGSSRYILEVVTEPLEVLSIPNEAIIESEGKQIVYVQVEKGHYDPREIQTGLQGELYTEIREGLKAGEQVVTFGSFFIDADHKLKGF
jgi:hypothetical protein